jgi:hypothetical protein
MHGASLGRCEEHAILDLLRRRRPLEDADHLDAVPGKLLRPRSIRPLDKPRGGGVKLGDAAISYSMSLNGAGISAMAS